MGLIELFEFMTTTSSTSSITFCVLYQHHTREAGKRASENTIERIKNTDKLIIVQYRRRIQNNERSRKGSIYLLENGSTSIRLDN